MQATALVRPLGIGLDPLALHAALSDGGTRRDTLLLERSVGPTLILDRAAIRVECRGQVVEAFALGEDGPDILHALAARFADRLVERTPDRLQLAFPAVSGADPAARLLAPSPFDVLRFLQSGMAVASPEEPFTLAALGAIAFDHVDLFEDLPAPADDRLGFPDFLFWLSSALVVIEADGSARAVATAFGPDVRATNDAAARILRLESLCGHAAPLPAPVLEETPPPAEADLPDPAFEALVETMKAHVAAGDVYQIVPSRTFSAPCPDPLAAFAALRTRDPSPYHFFFAGPDHLMFGASPETSVGIFHEGSGLTVEVKPIAGTRRRGATEDEDDRLEAELRLDAKELSEHMMLVDLARNDVARVSAPGTRRVSRLLATERYARVMHLVSSVTGRLRDGLDAVHALAACLNVGTLVGAPKIRATQLLRRHERTKRGPYGGAIGWLNGAGMLDSCVVIRSAVVRDGVGYVRAGAGVVHASDPAAEADETRRKAASVLSVLGARRADA